MTSSPRSSEAADVVDPPGIPAARRCGGGGGEIPAGLRQAGAGEKWRREAATRERERWEATLVHLPLSFYRQGAAATLFPRWLPPVSILVTPSFNSGNSLFKGLPIEWLHGPRRAGQMDQWATLGRSGQVGRTVGPSGTF